MTVSTEVNHNEYTGNGVTTSFPYTFRIFHASDLVVTTSDTNGTLRTLMLNTDYTVTGVGSYSGGAVVLPLPLANAWSISIERSLPVVQETDLRNQGKFFAETHEGAFDYLTMLIQQCFGWARLALLKPNFLAKYYDAKQNRIANLSDPRAEQDAVNNRSMRSYVDAAIAGVVGGYGWFIQYGAGAVYRTFQDKMRDEISIKDFGASYENAANNATAINNMAAAFGLVVIPHGNFAVEDISILVPIHFNEGASITVAAGFTVTISDSISSSKQHIFRGDGNYSLTHDVSTGKGENARQVHASWFGAFPNCNTPDPSAEDQSPYINKAFASMGNARESIVELDMGNYIIDGEILVTRAGWVKTAGTRRTVFLCKSDGWTAFRTTGPACRFADIQFELAPYLPARSSPFIQIDHGECEIYNGFFAQAARSIVLNSNNARVDNIMAVYGANPGAGSSLVEITQGSGNEVRNVMAGTSAKFGPEVLVRVGGDNQTEAISNFLVENVSHITPSKTVLVKASSFNIQRGTIRNARYNGYDGTAPDWSIELVTEGSSNIQDVIISDVVLSPMAAGAVALKQHSTGFMHSIILDSVTAYGTTGKGLLLEQTAGNMSSVFVGPNVSVKTRAVPITQTGTMRDVIVAPGILKDSLVPSSTSYNVADDAVVKVEMHRPVYTGRLEIDSITEFATCSLRTTAPLALTQINASANVGFYLTPLTGTTGPDGKLNIGVSEGFIYIENRLGLARAVTLTLATGIS